MLARPRWTWLALVSVLLPACTVTLSEQDLLHPWPQPLAPLSDDLQRRNIELQVDATTTLRGWYLSAPGHRRTLIYFYGNASSLMGEAGTLQYLASALAVDVVAFDYRGYGFSGGTPHFDALGADALAIYDFAHTTLAVPGDVLVFGYSLGSAAAIHLAANRPVASLVVRAPPSSLEAVADAADQTVPWYAKPFVEVRLADELAGRHPQPIEDISKVTAALLIIHGTDDTLTPPVQSEALLAAATKSLRKKDCAVAHATHQDLGFRVAEVRACLTNFAP